MEIFNRKRMVPYSIEQMFDIISDVERYAEFLQGWHNTSHLKREGNLSRVDQELGWDGFRIRFSIRGKGIPCHLRD